MAKKGTESVAIYVSPGSEVIEVIQKDNGSLERAYVMDGSPIPAVIDVTVDHDRFSELEKAFNEAMDEVGVVAGECGCDD